MNTTVNVLITLCNYFIMVISKSLNAYLILWKVLFIFQGFTLFLEWSQLLDLKKSNTLVSNVSNKSNME